MPTTTTTYALQKPTVGGDSDVWGGYLNDNADKLDDVLDGTLPITPAAGNDIDIVGTNAATNTVTTLLTLNSQSTGTPAAGIGSALAFAAETAAGNTEVGVVLEAVTTDVTAASEDFDLVIKTMAAGATAAERLRVSSTGVTAASLSATTALTTPSVTNAGTLALSATGANSITFANNGSTTMTLDASGYLLVGTTNNPAAAQMMVTKVGGAQGFEFLPGSSATVNTLLHYNRAGSAYLTSTVNALDHVWQNSGTERARIDSNGYLLIGYTSSNGAYRLQVNSQIFATSATIATSDGRYKENVTPISGALDAVNALNPVSFGWKQHPVHNFDRSSPTIGFIAQEVQTALADKPWLNAVVKANTCTITPEEKDEAGNVISPAVTEEFLGIAEGNLVALLTAAIKEASAKISALEARVAALEA